jgi:hypothetical protein
MIVCAAPRIRNQWPPLTVSALGQWFQLPTNLGDFNRAVSLRPFFDNQRPLLRSFLNLVLLLEILGIRQIVPDGLFDGEFVGLRHHQVLTFDRKQARSLFHDAISAPIPVVRGFASIIIRDLDQIPIRITKIDRCDRSSRTGARRWPLLDGNAF